MRHQVFRAQPSLFMSAVEQSFGLLTCSSENFRSRVRCVSPLLPWRKILRFWWALSLFYSLLFSITQDLFSRSYDGLELMVPFLIVSMICKRISSTRLRCSKLVPWAKILSMRKGLPFLVGNRF